MVQNVHLKFMTEYQATTASSTDLEDLGYKPKPYNARTRPCVTVAV